MLHGQADWSGVAFDTLEWRATGTFILRGLDDVQTLLDDQIVKTQGMRASPYIGPFDERVRLWEGKLNLTQEILDEWLKCQQVLLPCLLLLELPCTLLHISATHAYTQAFLLCSSPPGQHVKDTPVGCADLWDTSR